MTVTDLNYLLLPAADVPNQEGWLDLQPLPVIALGEGSTKNADVIVGNESETAPLIDAIEQHPIAAMTLVQVLRAVEYLPLQQAMTVESLAYATLQAGAEYRSWLASRSESPELVTGEAEQGEAVLIERSGDVLRAELNRPQYRNSISVEMRDALVPLFELVQLDDSIERLELRGSGPCFSIGGELREFGLAGDSAKAHQVRSLQNPGRLLAQVASRVHCHLHSACIGSGIEIPAFAGRVTADPKTFIQLPELKLGLIPGAGGCVSFSRRIGRQKTAWLALSGKKINAQRALEWGLIDEIVTLPG